MRLALIPRTSEFFDLFSQAGENALEAARLVEKRFRTFSDDEVRQSDVKALEHRGDELTREIVELLNTQYVTPFDREDIYELAKAIDDVVDHLENASDLLGLYKVDAVLEPAVDQCRVLVLAVEHLAKGISELRRLQRVQAHIVEVKGLEDEADRIVRAAIVGLFEGNGTEVLTVIRWKDIFEALEEAVDACETAADLVGNIVVKNI